MAKRQSNQTSELALTPELYLEYRRAIAFSAKALEAAQSEHQTQMKRAKRAGISTEALSLWMKLSKQDPEVREQLLRDIARYSAWEGKALGTQGQLFGSTDDQMPNERAQAEHTRFRDEDDGEHSGAGSVPREDNPHEGGSERHVSWDKGWLRGKEILDKRAAAMGDNVKKASTKRSKAREPRADA